MYAQINPIDPFFLGRGWGSLVQSEERYQGIKGEIDRRRGALQEASAFIFHAELKEKRFGFAMLGRSLKR
jgi:hypothetical protein